MINKRKTGCDNAAILKFEQEMCEMGFSWSPVGNVNIDLEGCEIVLSKEIAETPEFYCRLRIKSVTGDQFFVFWGSRYQNGMIKYVGFYLNNQDELAHLLLRYGE